MSRVKIWYPGHLMGLSIMRARRRSLVWSDGTRFCAKLASQVFDQMRKQVASEFETKYTVASDDLCPF